jgi:hypothetical protein
VAQAAHVASTINAYTVLIVKSEEKRVNERIIKE